MTNKRYFKIGLFVVIAFIIASAGVIALGAGEWFRKEVTVETYFDESVQGLDIGSSVKYRGILIGKVSAIEGIAKYYPTEKPYVLVRCALNAESFPIKEPYDMEHFIKSAIDKGLRFRLTPQGLTGSAFVEADYLDPSFNPPLTITWKPAYPYVPSAPSQIARLSDALTTIMRNLDTSNLAGLMTRLENVLDNINKSIVGANVEGVGQEARLLLAELRETNQKLSGLMSGEAVKEASAAVSGIRRLVEGSEEPALRLIESLQKTSADLSRLVSRLSAGSKDIPLAMTQLHVTMKRLDQILAGPGQDIGSAMENIRQITQNLKDLTERLEKYPAQLLYGQPPKPVTPEGNK